MGGGVSVSDILQHKDKIEKSIDTIAVNNAYKIFQKSVICNFMDLSWWGWNRDIIRNFYTGQLVAGGWKQHKNQFYDTSILCFEEDLNKSFTEDKNKICGSNSGHQAINLAYHMGYTTCYLIGFDCDVQSKNTHWHNDHLRQTNTDRFESTFVPGFDNMKNYIINNNIDFNIINLNMKSSIKCFDFMSIDDFISII